MFELETRRRSTPVINLSALIDIAFILVIFIVLAATFQRVRAVDVDLPRADARAVVAEDALVVRVPREGPLLIDEVIVQPEDARATFQAARASHGSVVLLSDRDVPIERAVRLLTDAQIAGFASVSIATSPGPEAR